MKMKPTDQIKLIDAASALLDGSCERWRFIDDQYDVWLRREAAIYTFRGFCSGLLVPRDSRYPIIDIEWVADRRRFLSGTIKQKLLEASLLHSVVTSALSTRWHHLEGVR